MHSLRRFLAALLTAICALPLLAADYSQGLRLSIAAVEKTSMQMKFENQSDQRIQLWDASMERGYYGPRLIFFHDGTACLAVKKTAGFTMNFPKTFGVGPGDAHSETLDFSQFMDAGTGLPLPQQAPTDPLIVIYQSKPDLEAIGRSVWMGETLGCSPAASDQWARSSPLTLTAAAGHDIEVSATMAERASIDVCLTNHTQRALQMWAANSMQGYDMLEFILFSPHGPVLVWHRPTSEVALMPETITLGAGEKEIRRCKFTGDDWVTSSSKISDLSFEHGLVILHSSASTSAKALVSGVWRGDVIGILSTAKPR